MPSALQNAPGSNLGIDRASNTIRLARDFDAPPSDIFEAWTKPEHVTCWWDAAGDPLAVCEIDLRRPTSRSHARAWSRPRRSRRAARRSRARA